MSSNVKTKVSWRSASSRDQSRSIREHLVVPTEYTLIQGTKVERSIVYRKQKSPLILVICYYVTLTVPGSDC